MRPSHHPSGLNQAWVPGYGAWKGFIMSKVIIVTGAGRGLGTDIARAVLDAGHQMVATGRRPDEVEKTLDGPQDNLLSIKLDITNLEDAHTAVKAAVERFGRIDVLVNNAGNFFCGGRRSNR